MAGLGRRTRGRGRHSSLAKRGEGKKTLSRAEGNESLPLGQRGRKVIVKGGKKIDGKHSDASVGRSEN